MEEAIRARDLALQKDFLSHRLSPDLDDERDWYKILGVGPTVKKQYNRMALNRLPGATEAFSLIAQARDNHGGVMGSQEKSSNCQNENPGPMGNPSNNSGFSGFQNNGSQEKSIGFSAFKNYNAGFSKFHIHPGPSPDQRNITNQKLLENRNKAASFGHNNPKSKTKRKKTEEEGDKYMLPPDSKLINFEKEREKGHFRPGQIWAVYDTLDGMPRFYALINKVISDNFKVGITWLEPCPNNDKEKKWLHKGLPASCGKFRLGASEMVQDHMAFSHMVNSKKDIREIYHVYPRKRETWALFKNWKMDWHLDPTRHMKGNGLDFVEILSNYRAGIGVKVAFLGKVKDFSTRFGRMSDRLVVPMTDRFRFSHRVLSFDVGLDGDSRTFELDPDSLP